MKGRRHWVWQFQLLDWIILTALLGLILQIWRLLQLLSGSRSEGGYVVDASPLAAYGLLATVMISGGIIGGALAVLGGWPRLFWRGFMSGAVVALLVPLLLLWSVYLT